MSIENMLLALRARFWVLILMPILAAGTAFLLLEDEPTYYSANAKLLIDYRTPLEGELAGELLPVGLQESYVATQLQIIKSHRVAKRALEMLGLEREPGWLEAFREETDLNEEFAPWAERILTETLQVTIGKDSRLVSIWYTDPNPAFAARVANAFADAYREVNQALSHAPAIESAQAVEPLLTKLRADLEEADRKLSAYQQNAGIIVTAEQLDLETAHLKELGDQRLQAEAREREAESRLASLEAMAAAGRFLDSLPNVPKSDLIQRLEIDLARAESQLAERSTTLGRRHPELIKISADLASLRDKLEQEKAKAIDTLRLDLLEARDFAERARASEAEQRDKVLNLKRNREGLQPLLREAQSARESYDRSLRMYSEYTTHGRLNLGNVMVLDRAEPPFLPSSPSRLVSLAAALAGGLLLAIGLVIVWELLDKRIRVKRDVMDMGAGPLLAELPRA
ncbi:hypothetical protein [Thiorhodococcus minor]|uniref:Chain length determinant protein EpsF n=1 Tax=Thiorhodococcus minor TaxID=57489 RepID=A0A6M0JZE4_9GAMM|nr:hypothetical protein [Thiorhodococcus minor]NEV62832.1 hypothetical protein [Thiorhodococcus minor]